MKALTTIDHDLRLATDLVEASPKKGEVKVRVRYASLNPTDLDIVKGDYDWFLRLYGARSTVRTGLEFSGAVVEDSERFKKGDQVFGYGHLFRGPKTHQEILSINEDYVARAPETIGLAEAAALPVGGQTSWVALKDIAKVQPGQSLLINGASGGVGVYAILLAKKMGLRVTAVAGPAGQAVMKELGADRVANYREEAIEELGQKFDAVLDLTTQLRFRDIRPLLAPRGVFIPADPLKNLADFFGNPFRSQKTRYLMVEKGDHEILAEIARLIDAGTLVAPKSRRYPIEEYRGAIADLSGSGVIGRIVLEIGGE